VRGTVEQPVLDGSASFHRASISSPVLRKPLTNFGGTVHVKSNRLCITSLDSRVSRRGKLFVKGNLPLRTSEASLGDKIDLKCEVLEVRAKNILRFITVISNIKTFTKHMFYLIDSIDVNLILGIYVRGSSVHVLLLMTFFLAMCWFLFCGHYPKIEIRYNSL
jgi:hypothetical protein